MMRAYLLIIIAIAVVSSMFDHSRLYHSVPNEARQARSSVFNSSNSLVSGNTSPSPTGQPIELRRSPNGHFYADVDVNGASVRMLVDTGATAMALSRSDAQKAGLAPSIAMPNVVGQGADGNVHGEIITVHRISLGDKTAEEVPAVILDHGEQSLLGQEFLEKFASVQIRGDTMILQ